MDGLCINMLPAAFLAAQQRIEYRDVLNFIHGFVSRSSKVSLHLEQTDGLERARKLNYVASGKTIVALWVLKNDFRLEVHDPTRQLACERLYESRTQFEKKGWRNLKFDPLNAVGLTEALRLMDECIALRQ